MLRYKTYTADTLQQALLKMYIDMGKDAVIISQREIKKGGIFGLFAKKQVQILAALPSHPRKNNADSTLEYKKEKPFYYYPPSCQIFYKKVLQTGIEEDFAKSILDEVVSNNSIKALQEEGFLLEKFQEALIAHIPIAGPIKADGKQSIVVLVGPTGVGKTTTLVKLAADFAFRKEKNVAFLTIDTYRVAAVEQLKVYANILDVPLKVVFTPEEFCKGVDEFRDYDIIFVDTGGRSQRNAIQIAELSRFLHTLSEKLDVHLLVSATTKSSDVISTIESFREIGAKKMIITKIDETESLGALLSVVAKSKMPISYITFGQNVPEDIEIATAQRLVHLIFANK